MTIKRRAPLKRTGQLKPVSTKRRKAESGWQRAKRIVTERAKGLCEVCRAKGQDVHHIVKRSQGGTNDPSGLIFLCRSCHDKTDWPYSKGRLCISLAGKAGTFLWTIVTAADKFSARSNHAHP